jgi:hypothetical protein
MREVMAIGIILEVWHKFIKVTRVGLERATRREMDISDDLVDTNSTRNVAPFIGLLVQLLCPMLVFALYGIPTRAMIDKKLYRN